MALNFKGETTTAVLNNTENVYKKDDLFRLYDAGVLKLGNVVCEHGDFVSWTGTAWKLEKDAGYAVETSGSNESLEERVGAIEEKIPEDASAENKLATDKKLSYLKQFLTNPLSLPDKTIRCKFTSGYTPTMGTSQTLVDAGENVWDITNNSTNWSLLFYRNDKLESILGANSTGIAVMDSAFGECTSLSSISLFDTSTVTSFSATFSACSALITVPLFDTSNTNYLDDMFSGCTALTSVPLFDTSKASWVSNMFKDCVNVKSGALALYQQVSTQASTPSNHSNTFKNCGSNTTTGAAELAQIPTSWGGTAAG